MTRRIPAALAWPPSLMLALAGCVHNPTEIPDPCTDNGPSLTITDRHLLYEIADCMSLELEAGVQGDGELSVTLHHDGDAVRPVVTGGSGGGTLRGVTLAGDLTLAGDEPIRVWKQGYQSWSWSGVLEATAFELDGQGIPMAAGDEDSTSIVDETACTSWWVGLAGRELGQSVLIGALSATKTKFYTAFDGQRAFAVWGHRGEQIAVAEGEGLDLDPVRFEVGTDPHQLYVRYAAAVAEQLGVTAPAAPPPTGWATWYQFYDDVTEDDVRANLEAAAEIGDDGELAPLEVFQIDDGWQVAWGDWTAGDDFGSGMAPLAADITAAGFTPGLWMAPLYVSRQTTTYAEHENWWVRDADGVEIVFSNSGTGDYAIIDATHPDAGAWMAQQVADRVAEGWTYLKLDFLYAAAQEGQRHDDVTGVEAYHAAMQLLRDAAGDAYVLACGAPLLPTVGYAQQYRTGADIAFFLSPDPNPGYLRWQARQTASRAWSNGVWWWIDPDQVILRDPFDDHWARGAVAAQAASGGAWLLGDDLPALDPQRLAWALDPEAVATRGQAAVPDNPLGYPSGLDFGPIGEAIAADDQVPPRWTMADGHVVLLNMDLDDHVELACPGGSELLTGATCGDDEVLVLAPGEGQIWRP